MTSLSDGEENAVEDDGDGKESDDSDHMDDVDTDVDTDVDDQDKNLPKGVRKRIGKLTAKFRAQERAAAEEAARRTAAEQEAQALRERIEALEKAKIEQGKPPEIDDFDTEAEYLEALTDYKIELRLSKEKEAARTKEAARNSFERESRIRSALQKGAEKYPDFNKVIADLEIPTDSLPVFEMLDNAGDVAYELGKKPNLAKSLSSMPPALAGAKLQEISLSIKQRKITKAPEPIRPVASQGGHVKTMENMSMAEYRAYRDRQEKKARGG